jgi:uncharacterized protein
MSPDPTTSHEPAIDPALLEILACPDCHGTVRVDGQHIRCQQCRRAYPVRGLPVMLVEESIPGA